MFERGNFVFFTYIGCLGYLSENVFRVSGNVCLGFREKYFVLMNRTNYYGLESRFLKVIRFSVCFFIGFV